MMCRTLTSALALGWVVACGGTVVEITVDARANVGSVVELRVVAENNGDSVEETFDISGRAFPLTFTITPEGRAGELSVTLRAADAGGVVIGAASGRADISEGGASSLDLRLDPADFLVNADIDGVQRAAFRQGRNGRAVTATPTGFAVTFVNDCRVAATCDVFVRRFDADGVALETGNSDSEFSVNTLDYPVVSVPAIAASATGELAIVWETDTSINVSQLRADGGRIANDLQVTVATVEDPEDPAILGRANDFVLTWFQESDPPDPAGLYQTTLSAGVLGATTLARDSGDVTAPSMAAATGVNILTAWTEKEAVLVEITGVGGAALEDAVVSFSGEIVGAVQAAQTSSGSVLSYGRSAADASRGLTLTELNLGGAFVRDVNIAATPRDSTDRPAIAASADGGIAATWTECGAAGDGDRCAIMLQLFNADLTAASEPIIVNTTTTGEQFDPAIASISTGFVLVWADASGVAPDTSGGIRARIIYSDML